MSLLDSFRRQTPSPPAKPRQRGGSGRGHTGGFLELEELNNDLRHPLGYAIYDRMYRTDSDVRQVLRLSIDPIIGGTWAVEPFGGETATERDQKIAEIVRWALFDFMRPNLLGHLIEFLPVLLRSGFTPGEKVWAVTEYEGKRIIAPKTIGLRLPRSIWRWHQGRDGDLEAIDQYVQAGGPTNRVYEYETTYGSGAGGRGSGPGSVRLDARDLIYYRVGAEGDNWEGVSLLRPAYKNWYLKDKIERIDAIAQEREAVGIPVVYPPPSASKEQLDDMEEILAAMRTNEQGYIVMPGMKAGESGTAEGSGWLLELVGFDRTGSGRDPQPSLAYHTNKIAAAFIAEFMRLGHGQTGARATAQVQADPFLMSIEALVTTVEQSLNDAIVAPMVAYNWADVDNPPRLKMSLVDSTSLSALADFVLKLTQVGALLPDQELEDFLRARADLPPANPEAVKERADDEETIRRMIVGGNPNPTEADLAVGAAANNDDPFGSNAKVGKHKNGKPAGSPQRRSGAPKGEGGRGQGSPRGPAKKLDALATPDDEWLGFHQDARWWELMVDLEEMAGQFDGAAFGVEGDGAPAVYRMAGEMADPRTPLGKGSNRKELAARIAGALDACYDQGGDHVRRELEAQGYEPGGRALDRGARDRGRGHLWSRADLAAESVELAMRSALLGTELAYGQLGPAMAAAEKAGLHALRQEGRRHGVAAFLHGRHDEAVTLAAQTPLKVRYTSILDDNRCGPCDAADDGQARALDDPVRVEHQPPNPHCDSVASGHNLCRCFEVYVIDAGEGPTSLDRFEPEELPPYVRRVARVLTQRGMDPEQAIVTAVKIARTLLRTGRLLWPGLKSVGAGDVEDATQAVEWAQTVGV